MTFGLALGGFPLGLSELGGAAPPIDLSPFTFDGPNKLVILDPGTVEFSVRALWSRWADWMTLSDNAKFLPLASSLGGDDVDLAAGTKVPAYVFLLNGWKVRPQEATHTLTVKDGILLVSGGGDPFVNTLGTFVVRVNYQQPVQAISFTTGGGGGYSGPSAAVIAAAVRAELAVELARIDAAMTTRTKPADVQSADVQKVRGQSLVGSGVELDPWGPA